MGTGSALETFETGRVLETGGAFETGRVLETGGAFETGRVLESGGAFETGMVLETGGGRTQFSKNWCNNIETFSLKKLNTLLRNEQKINSLFFIFHCM